MPKIIEGIVEHLKPEAAYLTPTEGDRTCFMVFDMLDAAELPSITEPFFHSGANITVRPVMILDDLRSGTASPGR